MFNKVKEILKKKELDPEKYDVELEKGDFLALLIAAAMTMLPVLIGIFALFGLLTWIIF
ncbi:hypothetical protein [Fusibacter tunisiensis]|uniref:Membrane protein YqjE n=1 Tax=Fusibacter tunisiensis TaxID=1008308 RepID=A0ABS2MSP4_9FIRM|nr:hypothetical protein [Fusibacter tunisiensis]MBM7562453.1 putative membrane protein YqjE [Fusibacter tunisiensis]